MTHQLSKTTRLKLIVPLLYALLALIYFVTFWPETLQWRHVLAVIITMLSFVLWIVARIQLGDSFTIAPKAKKLVKTGLYSKLRHPVYYFSISTVFGLYLFRHSLAFLAALILLTLLELYRRRLEEQKLLKVFGEEYKKYMESTWL